MKKSFSYSSNNTSLIHAKDNIQSIYYNISNKKDELYKKIKKRNLSSTPNITNKRIKKNYYTNKTYSNKKENNSKINNIKISSSGKSNKRFFSISYNNNNYMHYLEPKNNKYIGIDLNLISNSSNRKNENTKSFFKDKEEFKINEINNFIELKKNEDEKIIQKNSLVNEDDKDNNNDINDDDIFIKNNEEKNILEKNNKKYELNSSISSNIGQNSNLKNISIGQSTPVSSFHPYEADSSPTNYIKSYTNINNLTYLTNNNSKKINNKNEEDEEKKSMSTLNINNQSEFTYINNSNKKSEKEEEKRISEKLEKIHKLRKNNKKKKKKIIINNNNNSYNNNNSNKENIFINNDKICSRNIIEEKEEEYLNSLNNKLIISKEKENENDELEKEEILLREKLKKEKEKKELKEKERKDRIKEEKKYETNLENNKNLLEEQQKKKKVEGKKRNKNNIIEIKDTNFMNNINQITYNNQKSSINTKLNFNYFSPINPFNNNENKYDKKDFTINLMNLINLKEPKSIIKNTTSYFYINPERQSQFGIISKEEKNIKKIENNKPTSFNFNFISQNNKRKILKQSLINENINIIPKNDNNNINTFEQIYLNNKNNNIFYRNYTTSLGNDSLNKTKNILFQTLNKEINNTNMNIINNIPHHNTIGRNKGTIWNEYTLNSKNSSYRFSNECSKNKFNRKTNSFVLPANPFDSINKAKEYFFFNN